MTSQDFAASRQTMGLSQTELAALMGMRQQHISRIEAGHRQPTIQQADHMAALMVLHRHGLLGELRAEL